MLQLLFYYHMGSKITIVLQNENLNLSKYHDSLAYFTISNWIRSISHQRRRKILYFRVHFFDNILAKIFVDHNNCSRNHQDLESLLIIFYIFLNFWKRRQQRFCKLFKIQMFWNTIFSTLLYNNLCSRSLHFIISIKPFLSFQWFTKTKSDHFKWIRGIIIIPTWAVAKWPTMATLKSLKLQLIPILNIHNSSILMNHKMVK